MALINMITALPVGEHGILALSIPVEWAAIIIPALLLMLSGGIAHLKVVWDIRGELRHVGEKVTETLGDIDHIRRDVDDIKVSHAVQSAHHEERITALERVTR
jgi:hypothetical protein